MLTYELESLHGLHRRNNGKGLDIVGFTNASAFRLSFV